METKYKNYLEDTLEYLIDKSIEVRCKSEKTKDPFDQGMSFAYYEIIDHILNQAEIFDIKDDLKDKIKKFSPSM